MKKHSFYTRVLAMLLALAMVIAMAACGKQPEEGSLNLKPEGNTQQGGEVASDDTVDTTLPVENDRASLEQVVELLGDGQSTEDMTDEELSDLVDDLVGSLENEEKTEGIVDTDNTDEPAVDLEVNPDNYDEDGAMKEPFDQVYPELIENESVEYDEETLLIKLPNGTGLTSGLSAAGVASLEAVVPLSEETWYEAKLVAGTDAKCALESVRALNEVRLAEYNYVIQTAALDDYTECDKHYGHDNNEHHKDQWHMHHCGLSQSYDYMVNKGGDPSVVVAVIDTGVDYDHEDLKDNMWVNTAEIPDNGIDDDNNGYIDDYYGVDIVAGKGNGDDTNGHGTHVAGIIAAQNNNLGTVGIAYNVKIMSVKAAMHSGYLHQSDIAKAILYAYEHGAEVINMSFGGTACSIAVQDALATAYTRCVLVASAGNNGAKNEGFMAIPNYPAALTYVLGVMSVDKYGRESGFTNWDVAAFNGVEYELYAPGESIMSTLPNNQYGQLSGTSMAAPIVSAMAAILRSEFSDRDMYPTKFIYGQLASTSGQYAICLDPEYHGPHNLPQIVDLYSALTKMPQPEVSYQDYRLFDDPKYSEKNNGDGVIDAGETIALGFTLRNRWGMSKNTFVTIDTKSQAGIDDPYITIHNPTVDYDSVGTYSTQDCGKVWTDELWTGWEDPFLITVSEDCPNDYIFKLNITITCENALDEEDTTVYTSSASLNEAVRSGYLVPSLIEEDMVWTEDNLYIVTNGTIIQEGVTVRVEPGTNIQFWTDDPNDTYAATYIPFLLVNGQFLVEGTKEEPVYIYPSDLMDKYGVEIGSSSTGNVELRYADITNFFYQVDSDHTGTGNRINLAENCTFRRNYSGVIWYRYISGGNVYDTYDSGYWCYIGDINAKNCIFYKYSALTHRGFTDGCVFTECGLSFQGVYRDCVFLKNSMVDQTSPNYHMNSSMNVNGSSVMVSSGNWKVYYREETGTTYLYWKRPYSWTGSEIINEGAEYRVVNDQILSIVKELYGGDYVVCETEEEYKWLTDQYIPGFAAGIRKEDGLYVWHDGTPLPESLQVFTETRYPDSNGVYHIYQNSYTYERSVVVGLPREMLFEIPGNILPTEITFDRYELLMDMETTAQVAPVSKPAQLPVDLFLYESTDEAVVTVNESGLITPVGLGTADIWVYSLDKAVSNHLTVTVKEYVPLESIGFKNTTYDLAIGESMSDMILLEPADTTRINVVFSSSDEGIASVSSTGVITGVSSGTATITATCEGLTASATVTVYQKATSLGFANLALTASLSEESVALPELVLSEGAEPVLTWRSTNKEVADIADGALVLKTAGVCSLIVEDTRSGLSASCLLNVLAGEKTGIRLVDGAFILMEDGTLYYINTSGVASVLEQIDTNVKTLHSSENYVLYVKEDGTVFQRNVHNAYGGSISFFQDKTVEKLAYYHANDAQKFALTEDGYVYAWGGNSKGQLGIGTTTSVGDAPELVNLEGVVDIATKWYTAWYLTDAGILYYSGRGEVQSLTPKAVAENVSAIVTCYGDDTPYCYVITNNGKFVSISTDGAVTAYPVEISDMESVDYAYNDNLGYCIYAVKNGVPCLVKQDGSQTVYIDEITNASMISYIDRYYTAVIGADGTIYCSGYDNLKFAPIVIDKSAAIPDVVASSLVDGVLSDCSLEIEFDLELLSTSAKLYADGTQIPATSEIHDYNRLVVSRTSGFSEGVSYELVIELNNILAVGGNYNAEEIRIPFTYVAGENIGTDDDEPVENEVVINESILDESVQRILTAEDVATAMQEAYNATYLNPRFSGNAVLNPISTDDVVEHWLRPISTTVSVGTYHEIPFGGNWWGSTNTRAIELQMTDYEDFRTYAKLVYAPFLTEAPENTFPFVTSVKLFNKAGEEVTTVGNEEVRFRITFNRDMDTSIPLLVRFGSAYPYGDYEFEGEYIDARTWEGVYTLNTIIENGNQFFTISNGCSATEDLELQLDRGRFGFVIDTTAAQALIMQGHATETGIQLSWTQDDFDTLMGYNVYRSDAEDGLYTMINKTTIPFTVKEFFDDTVEPGKQYFYNFTVVKTDLTESEPSGKITLWSMDTMAPDIYHSPVANAFTGSNLVITATVTDNLSIAYARVHYRITGTETWKTVQMNKLNDKYSAIIPASDITTAGLEYYIEAFDGVSYTYKGTAETPNMIAVQEAIDDASLGDVNGDGVITNFDALLLLYAINDKYNPTAEEFARADLDGDKVLTAVEALRILRYVSGDIGSVKMS